MAHESLRNDAAPPLSSAPVPAGAAPATDTKAKARRRIRIQREIVVLLAMLVFNLIFTPHFWSLQTFNVNLTQVVTIVIVGIGMTLVVATGGIDLSVGASMAISGALAPMLFMNIEGPAGVALAFVLPVLAAALCGVFNGLLVTRLSVQPIVATLVTSRPLKTPPRDRKSTP